MLTKTAELDIKSLRQNGFSPTDEEVVRLNDLAIRIERGKDTTPANMPRVAFAGNVILHEPTIGAIEWWNDFGKDSAWSNAGRLMTYFFMLANARNLEFLNSLRTPKEIRKAVKSWKKTIDATTDELWRATMWAKFGGEHMSLSQKKLINDSLSSEEVMNALWFNLIAAAGALGLPPSSLKTQTQSELVATLVQANIHARIPMKQSIAEDYIAYRQLIRQIEERKTKEDGEQKDG